MYAILLAYKALQPLLTAVYIVAGPVKPIASLSNILTKYTVAKSYIVFADF